MNFKVADDLLLKKRKKLDTLVNQTRTRPQKATEFKWKKPLDTFPLNPPLELEEEKFTNAATTLEVYNLVLNRIGYYKIFTIVSLRCRQDPDTIEIVQN